MQINYFSVFRDTFSNFSTQLFSYVYVYKQKQPVAVKKRGAK